MTCSPLEQFAIVPLVPKWIHRFRTSKKENILCATPDYLFQLLWFLRCHTNTRFGILIDICGVDYPSQKRRFGVVYNLLSIQYNSRIRIRIGVDEITPVSSVISIFPSAGWWEREVWDMFGLYFSHHHDLRRILTDYGFEGHPLRKDFPLSGYAEVRYDDSEKRVVSEPVEMTQEFRYFDLASPWRLMPSRSLSGTNKRSVAAGIGNVLSSLTRRNYCTSGEDSNSESEETLTEIWDDQVATLKSISSSLKEGGLVRENHLTELTCVGRDLARDEIPNLEWVVKDAATVRSSENGGVDPADQQVKSVLVNIEVARDVARFLINEDNSFLSKGPRKRNMPGEGEARAAELHGLLEDRVIPAVNDVIITYRELVAITANEASNGSDSSDGDSVSSDTDSGGDD